ncbi:MAG: hypothetical protein JWP87_3891 [Labilithrix sp.]|nr:hypothetical protein [Labilithrix sp.]
MQCREPCRRRGPRRRGARDARSRPGLTPSAGRHRRSLDAGARRSAADGARRARCPRAKGREQRRSARAKRWRTRRRSRRRARARAGSRRRALRPSASAHAEQAGRAAPHGEAAAPRGKGLRSVRRSPASGARRRRARSERASGARGGRARRADLGEARERDLRGREPHLRATRGTHRAGNASCMIGSARQPPTCALPSAGSSNVFQAITSPGTTRRSRSPVDRALLRSGSAGSPGMSASRTSAAPRTRTRRRTRRSTPTRR